VEQLKHEYAINLVNHRYEIDWLIGLVAAQKLGILGVSSIFILVNPFKRILFL
jgi:hypothetical protein